MAHLLTFAVSGKASRGKQSRDFVGYYLGMRLSSPSCNLAQPLIASFGNYSPKKEHDMISSLFEGQDQHLSLVVSEMLRHCKVKLREAQKQRLIILK